VKIGPVDTEIALLIVKKEKKKINASKIYSPSGKFAERAKQIQAVNIKCKTNYSTLRMWG